jgi:hypothetical protein
VVLPEIEFDTGFLPIFPAEWCAALSMGVIRTCANPGETAIEATPFPLSSAPLGPSWGQDGIDMHMHRQWLSQKQGSCMLAQFVEAYGLPSAPSGENPSDACCIFVPAECPKNGPMIGQNIPGNSLHAQWGGSRPLRADFFAPGKMGLPAPGYFTYINNTCKLRSYPAAAVRRGGGGV